MVFDANEDLADAENVKFISSDYTTSGETTVLIDKLTTIYDFNNQSYTGNTDRSNWFVISDG